MSLGSGVGRRIIENIRYSMNVTVAADTDEAATQEDQTGSDNRV